MNCLKNMVETIILLQGYDMNSQLNGSNLTNRSFSRAKWSFEGYVTTLAVGSWTAQPPGSRPQVL